MKSEKGLRRVPASYFPKVTEYAFRWFQQISVSFPYELVTIFAAMHSQNTLFGRTSNHSKVAFVFALKRNPLHVVDLGRTYFKP